jgi:hypothetical protein
MMKNTSRTSRNIWGIRKWIREKLNLWWIFDRTIKPYILILVSIFAASFLAGTLAPASVRNEVTEAFQFGTDSYRGLGRGYRGKYFM